MLSKEYFSQKFTIIIKYLKYVKINGLYKHFLLIKSNFIIIELKFM